MPVKYAPPPDEKKAAHVRRLKSNVFQMQAAYKVWNASRTEADLEPVIKEVVESIEAIFNYIKTENPDAF